MDIEAFGRRLCAERERAGLTQLELAMRTGVDPATISRTERGLKSTDIETVEKFAAALGVLPELLLWGRSTGPVAPPAAFAEFLTTPLGKNAPAPVVRALEEFRVPPGATATVAVYQSMCAALMGLLEWSEVNAVAEQNDAMRGFRPK